MFSTLLNHLKSIFSIMPKQEYIDKNREWLAAKSREEGVMPIDKGIFYKVINRGAASGQLPNRNSVVVVHYTGRLINGKQFDSSRGGAPAALRLRELIPGWQIALQQMRPGDRWELYLPAEQAYGKRGVPGIPGGSTLVFDIELKNIG